ncbi:hypothetical protein AgCh_033960 [Apium graveolens]
MAKVIFLAGTADFWSYERSDTLVRKSVNTSGEKSETHVSDFQKIFRRLVAAQGIPTGVTHLQRIGVGLVLSAISMVVAGIVETHHKSVAVEYNMVDFAEHLPMTVFWGSQKELDEAKMRFAAAEVSS